MLFSSEVYMHAVNLGRVIPAKNVQSGTAVKNYQRKTTTKIIVQKLIKRQNFQFCQYIYSFIS